MAGNVRDRDRGWDRLLRELRGAKGLVGKSGVIGEKAAEKRSTDPDGPQNRDSAGRFLPKDKRPQGNGITNAELALVHEFGDGKVPERSFIRKPFDDNRAKYESHLATFAKAVYAGKMKVEKAIGLVAAEMASDVRKYVKTGPGVPPPNAPATIARKGSSRPLVDTSQMINAVTWAVVREGEDGGDSSGGSSS